jgi:hypothetical protein
MPVGQAILARAAGPARIGRVMSLVGVPMLLAPVLGRKPREVAGELAARLDVADVCASAEVSGPGFINLTLSDGWLGEQATAVLADERLGVPPIEAPLTMPVDYSAPNVAKEMHVGHLRTTIIGDCLARVLGHLGAAGPSEPEDLKVELGLKPKELKLLLSPLELCGAVVRRNGTLERWDQLFPEPSEAGGGLEELVVVAVRAAVVAPEKEIGRWFSWRWLFSPELVDRLVAAGRLERPERGWIAAA